jgi:hypothetical protein
MMWHRQHFKAAAKLRQLLTRITNTLLHYSTHVHHLVIESENPKAVLASWELYMKDLQAMIQTWLAMQTKITTQGTSGICFCVMYASYARVC